MLIDYVSKVVAHVASTDHKFSDLYRRGVRTAPIPFFGDILSAKILTVGVNPSCGEFIGRCWPESEPSPEYLESRLQNYFQLKHPPAHPWFATWEKALNQLEQSSYRTNAAHLDLSPRPTELMSNLPQKRFLDLISEDVGLFFEALAFCPSVKLLLLAGTVTNKHYMFALIRKHAKDYDFELVENGAEGGGQAFVSWFELKHGKRTWPVFFCSVGPSAPNSFRLPQRVAQHREKLLTHLRSTGAIDNPSLPMLHNIQRVAFEDSKIVLDVDGLRHRLPLAVVSPRLAAASEAQRNYFRVSASGYGIHWPEIDEDLSVDGLLRATGGKPSNVTYSSSASTSVLNDKPS